MKNDTTKMGFSSIKTNKCYSFLFIVILILSIFGCGSDDSATSPSKSKVSCEAGCSSMRWSIEGETGPRTTETSCRRNWVGNNYSEDCTGTIMFSNSGKKYNFSATYDWINCEMTVTVSGVGSCSDKVGTTPLAKECDCFELEESGIITRVKRVASNTSETAF